MENFFLRLPYKNEKNVKFYKSHKDKGFEEPIYVFLSSVGISELIFLPNSFMKIGKIMLL